MHTVRNTAHIVSYLGSQMAHSHIVKSFMALSLAWRWLFKSKNVTVIYVLLYSCVDWNIYIYNKVNIRGGQCLLRGTDWVYKYISDYSESLGG